MPKGKSDRLSFQSVQSFLALVIIILCTSFISQTDRQDFWTLFSLFSISFLAFFSISRKDFSRNQILLIALLMRLVLLISFPNLSDDIYRFIWDGRVATGSLEAVYTLLPDKALGVCEGCNQALYEKLNSKLYYSVYPPVMQWSLLGAAFLSGQDFLLNTVLIKLLLLVADMGLIYFMIRILEVLTLNIKWTYLYAFNPLIILETAGNCHFEGLMLMFVCWAWLLLIKSNGKNTIVMVKAGILFGLAVLTKLTCLLFLPLLFGRLELKKVFWISLVVLLSSLLISMPFISEMFFINLSKSLDLYFRSFEFNASIFYLINHFGSSLQGYDTVQIVGPVLAVITLIVLTLLTFKKKKDWKSYFTICLIGYSVYLFLSTTIHPWYVINLVVLSVLTGYRFPVIWSFLIFLSYYMYGNNRIEPAWLLIVEYGIVFLYMFLEVNKSKRIKNLVQFVPLFQEGDSQESQT